MHYRSGGFVLARRPRRPAGVRGKQVFAYIKKETEKDRSSFMLTLVSIVTIQPSVSLLALALVLNKE